MSTSGKLEFFLEKGTWLSTLVVAIGVLFSIELITQLGIGMFILIPILRVLSLCIHFYVAKDLKMFAIALIVFFIILASLAIGIIFY